MDYFGDEVESVLVLERFYVDFVDYQEEVLVREAFLVSKPLFQCSNFIQNILLLSKIVFQKLRHGVKDTTEGFFDRKNR